MMCNRNSHVANISVISTGSLFLLFCCFFFSFFAVDIQLLPFEIKVHPVKLPRYRYDGISLGKLKSHVSEVVPRLQHPSRWSPWGKLGLGLRLGLGLGFGVRAPVPLEPVGQVQ